MVLNITGGTYGKIMEDGAAALPATYNVSGATIRVADSEQLKQAVAMASASGDPVTVVMTADIASSFDVGNSLGTASQNLILDMGGKKLTLVEAVGSNGTKSNGIRVLANSSMIIRNGEIYCSSEAADNIKVGIANYGSLVLDGVKLYSGILTMYGINNRGDLTLKGQTAIYNGNGEKFVSAVTNDPYEFIYTDRAATFNCADDAVFVESLLVERYARKTTNAAGVVLNITGGTYGKIMEDGAAALPATYNVSGATIRVADSEQLKQAVAMASASGDPVTVVMTADIASSFDVGNSLGTAPQNLILDMGGKKLTLVEAVGSNGTKSNGIRVLANSSMIIRNGEIYCSSEAADNIKVGIANYGSLLLDGVKLYSGILTMYGINNRGDLTLKGQTAIYNGNGEKFVSAVTNDPYEFIYTDRAATFNCADDAVFVESLLVERYARKTTNAAGVVLNITGGTFGKLFDDGQTDRAANYNITGGIFGNDITAFLNTEDYECVEKNGSYVVTFIKKVQDGFGFAQNGPFELTYEDGLTFENVATGGSVADATVSYAIVEEGSTPGAATVDAATGLVTVLKAGTVIIEATLVGNEIYLDAAVRYELKIVPAARSASFAMSNVEVTYGTRNYSGNALNITNQGNGTQVVYSIVSGGDIASIDSTTGELTFADQKVGTVVVKAVVFGDDCYADCEVTYTVAVDWLPLPTNVDWSVTGEIGTNGWYKSNVQLTAPEGYTIGASNSMDSEDWQSSIEFTTEGTTSRVFYLKNIDGCITAAKSFEVKIDKTAPVVQIEYIKDNDSNLFTWLGQRIFGSNKQIKIVFHVTGSDIALMEWSKDGVTYEPLQPENGAYTVTISEEYRGQVRARVRDWAGWVVDTDENGTLVLVDQITPDLSANFREGENGESGASFPHDEQDFMNSSAETFYLDFVFADNNFDLTTITVDIERTNGESQENVALEWFPAEDGNSATATLALAERDEYIIRTEFSDPVNSGTRTYKVRLYNSEPELKVESIGADQVVNTIGDVHYYKNESGVKLLVSVSDDFFSKGESGVIVNGEHQVIAPENWFRNAQTGAYMTNLHITDEGAYEVQVFYNTAWNGEKTGNMYSFVLDTTAPSVPHLEYKEISTWEQLLDNWFGFYNGQLTVFVENVADSLAGVARVEYSLDGGITYEEVAASDEGYAFTVDPDYRGQITVRVTDNALNTVVFGESKIVILDTTEPVIEKIEFKGNVTDHNDPIIDASSSDPNFSVVFRIAEDNLDVAPEQPKVYYKLRSELEWGSANVIYSDNNHTVEFPMTVKNGIVDGVYQVKIVVQDHFTIVEESVDIRIDRTAPDISVQMAASNNSQDNCEYYGENVNEVALSLVIAEENFDAANVLVEVKLNGEKLPFYTEDAKNNRNWLTSENRHTNRMVFDKEGAYEITITCTDTLGTAGKPSSGTDTIGNSVVRKFVIDRTKPDASITYTVEEENWIQTLKGLFGFNSETITATLNVSDALAGVEQVLVSVDGENFEEIQKDEAGNYLRNVEERGKLTLKVTDKACNETVVVEERAVVVDKSVPGITTKMDNDKFHENGDILYTNHDPFAFDMTIADMDTYDLFAGMAIVMDNDIAMADLVWENTETSGQTTISVAGEGQHRLSAGISTGLNEANWKKTIVVDTTLPVIEIGIDGSKIRTHNGFDYYCAVPTVTVTIDEVNFDAADVELVMTAERVALDEDGNVVELPDYAAFAKKPENWTVVSGTNKHVLTLDVSTDAAYQLTVNYKDLATNAAESKNAKFVVDTVAPSVDQVVYSQNAVNVIGEQLTFGFFKADVSVQVIASDHTAGVQYVDYKVEGTMGKNDTTSVVREGRLTADKNGEFESFPLSADFQGIVTTVARDYSGNAGTQSKVPVDQAGNEIGTVVVDAIAPVVTPSLNTPVNTVKHDGSEDVLYYNAQNPAGLTLTVEEANFYEELFTTNVMVIQKNYEGDETGYEVAPWSSNATTHVQNITMNKDAGYKVAIVGEDYSGNKMESYTTPVMILDTIAPVIDVKLYAANEQGEFDMTQEAVGSNYENNPVTYYGTAIRAVITITERNFNAEDVVFTVGGVDPLENELSFTIDPSKWVTDGDVHTYVLDFAVDGTYNLDVAYTDLAMNQGNDVAAMNFNVDNANPDILVEGIVDGSFNKEAQTAIIKITDANFVPDAEHLTYNITYTNSVGEALKVDFPDLHDISYWTKTSVEGKVQWSVELNFAIEANYTISLAYTDLSGRVGYVHDTGNTDTALTEYAAAFTVDGTIPEGLTIGYSERSNEVEGIYYYKAPATLTLTAQDGIAGLEKFILKVTSEGLKAATTIDLPKNGAEIIDGSSDLAGVVLKSVENEKGQMVAVLEIPAQFNGRIGFTAIDKAGNSLDVTDLQNNLGVEEEQVKTIVVDTIAPVLTAQTAPTQILEKDNQETVAIPEDGNAANMTGVVLYYADKAEYKFTMTEANFFADEVAFTVNEQSEELTWTVNPENADEYVAIWSSDVDNDYKLELKYTDRSTNETATYVSQRIVVDTKAPVMTVEFRNDPEIVKNTDARDYYDAERYAVITIVDENFRPADVEIQVEALDVTGAPVGGLTQYYLNRGKTQNAADAADEQKWSAYYEGTWRREDDTYTIVIPFTTDANYTVAVSYKDLVLKEARAFAAKPFAVDKTKPENLTMSYKVSPVQVVLEGITFGFYDAQLDVTITAEDATSGVDHFVYSYINREGVSSVNAELINEKLAVAKYSQDNKKATATFTIPQSALGKNNQFNGTIRFDAIDRSSNMEAYANNKMGVVVDNISPTASVSFNEPVQTVNGTEYYNGTINGRIVITEANFYSNDVQVVITRDGVRYDTRVSWKDNSVDEHVGTFTLDREGDYVVTINYSDKSSNKMAEYKSATKVIDLAAPTIHVSNVVAESANNDDVYTFTITVEDADANLMTEHIKPVLTGIFRNADGSHTAKEIELGNAVVAAKNKTFVYTVQDLPEDGIYTLTCSVVDLAKNRSDDMILDDGVSYKQVRFSINRKGSTFAYGDDATQILAKNYFVQNVGHDLVIHEINVDPIQNYTVMLNGVALTEGEGYTTTITGGNDKWCLREYVISEELFADEGEYSVVVSSVDATNATVYSDMRNLNMSFVVDATEPAIIVGGLETEGRYQTDKQIVTMYPSDEGGSLQSVKVVLYGTNADPDVDDPVDTLFEMSGEELHDYLMVSGGKIEFEVPEGYRQVVRIICTDYAVDADGNVNTYIETLTHVTVSPNGLMIFFADKPLFYSTVGGVAAVLAIIIFLVARKKKKKEETPAA